tara:strand:+ start:290 stop:685 length:396 start_codon:yes stop_codon:yes gene_type:complete
MKSNEKYLSFISIPISIGELIDKITILEIKKLHMSGIKLNNVEKELTSLKSIIQDQNIEIDINLITSLQEVNSSLWEIEDKLRIKEKQQDFNHEFIELARSVYLKNDKRAFIKKEINIRYNSEFIEEKSYK